MNGRLVAVAVCLSCGALLMAGEPPKDSKPAARPAVAAPRPPASEPVPMVRGRKSLEALLTSPAGLDFGERSRVTAAEVIEQLHDRHHVSIRFDTPTFAGLLGSEAPAAAKPAVPCTAYGCPAPVGVPMIFSAPATLVPQPYVALPAPATATPAPLAYIAATAAEPAAPAVLNVPPTAASNAGAAPAASVPPAAAVPPRLLPRPTAPAAAAAAPNPIAPAAEIPYVPAAPAALPPIDPSVAPAAPPAADAAEVRRSVADLLKVEIDLQTVDLKSVSVATALRMALDAAPLPTFSEELGGFPIPLTNAMLLEYLVEEDGLVITTRMRALSHKETRVYSVKHLHDLPGEQLAKTIRQAVRPWSWRAQIADLGEQLKSTPVPAETISSLLKTGVQLAGAEIGATVTTPDEPQPAGDGDDKKSDEIRVAAMMGNAMVNGLVTFAQATLATLEMFHYAEPPTATIQALPGKLVITQSQAAHREISELLKQLADE